MHARTSYIASGLVHALLVWALAAGNERLRPEFAVRSGQALPVTSQAARASSVAFVIDSRLLKEPRETVVFPQPEFPKVYPEKDLPPPAADLDGRYIPRPPLEESVRRRMERGVVARIVAMADSPQVPADTTTPEVDGRRLDPLWAPVPVQESPTPERVVTKTLPQRPPVTVAAVIDTGTADQNALASSAPQGAKVDHLPKPLPNNREPVYPDELRRRRIGGRVLLRVTIGPDGQVINVSVAESSGESSLDTAAVSAIRSWRFEPARSGTTAVAFEVQLPIQFSIRE